jgi:hypothetical protein
VTPSEIPEGKRTQRAIEMRADSIPKCARASDAPQSGQAMSAVALLRKVPKPSDRDIDGVVARGGNNARPVGAEGGRNHGIVMSAQHRDLLGGPARF